MEIESHLKSGGDRDTGQESHQTNNSSSLILILLISSHKGVHREPEGGANEGDGSENASNLILDVNERTDGSSGQSNQKRLVNSADVLVDRRGHWRGLQQGFEEIDSRERAIKLERHDVAGLRV